MITLPHSLRELATRTSDDSDANLLWRAAKQLELLYANYGIFIDKTIPQNLSEARMDGERRLLLRTLFQTKGNKTAAAAQLNISRVAFYKQLRRHKIDEQLCKELL